LRMIRSPAVTQSTMLGPVRCDDIAREALIQELVHHEADHPQFFFNLNAHALNLALKDPAVAELFNASCLTFCDGFGILVLDRIFGSRLLRHRATPPDFIEEVYRGLCDCGASVFFLGDEECVVANYAARVERNFPGIVAGYHHGFFELGSREDEAVIDQINAVKPDLLLLGMGMPRQERWAVNHASEVRCKRMLSVGALFAWSNSPRRRGPTWATNHGLEWLCRLWLEPRRVWNRYLIGLPEVAIRLLLHSWK